MNFFFKHNSVKDLKDETDKQTVMPIQANEHNINEGGEFLDDAIRMKDQSLIDSEKNIDALNFDDLFGFFAE